MSSLQVPEEGGGRGGLSSSWTRKKTLHYQILEREKEKWLFWRIERERGGLETHDSWLCMKAGMPRFWKRKRGMTTFFWSWLREGKPKRRNYLLTHSKVVGSGEKKEREEAIWFSSLNHSHGHARKREERGDSCFFWARKKKREGKGKKMVLIKFARLYCRWKGGGGKKEALKDFSPSLGGYWVGVKGGKGKGEKQL